MFITLLLGTSLEPLPVSEGKWDQSTCELLSDTLSPASETFVIFSSQPTSIVSTTWSQTRKSCQRSTGTSHSREQAPLCSTKSHQRWVTAPWRINKQALQRLKQREDIRHFALFLTTALLSCTPKTSDLCPPLSCCHGEGPTHDPLCSEESLNY